MERLFLIARESLKIAESSLETLALLMFRKDMVPLSDNTCKHLKPIAIGTMGEPYREYCPDCKMTIDKETEQTKQKEA